MRRQSLREDEVERRTANCALAPSVADSPELIIVFGRRLGLCNFLPEAPSRVVGSRASFSVLPPVQIDTIRQVSDTRNGRPPRLPRRMFWSRPISLYAASLSAEKVSRGDVGCQVRRERFYAVGGRFPNAPSRCIVFRATAAHRCRALVGCAGILSKG
jgi:hypothetical protein